MNNCVTLTTLAPGLAEGNLLLLQEPLSFWGGYDAVSGTVIDQRHPQRGERLAGAVLLMSKAKGSSSSSSVLAEAIRAGTAPAAIIMRERDLIVALGSLVAAELYSIRMPVLIAEADVWTKLANAPSSGRFWVDAENSVATVSLISPLNPSTSTQNHREG